MLESSLDASTSFLLGDGALMPQGFPVSDSLSSSFSSSQNLVVIDGSLPEIETLISGLQTDSPTKAWVILDGQQNGIDQITQILDRYSASNHFLNSLEIISHGQSGGVQLGIARLDFKSLTAQAQLFEQWGQALAPDADILFYGCNLAAGPDGLLFLQQLSELTGADIAASNDLTGKAGDWQLEVTTGSIETDLAVGANTQASFGATLALLVQNSSFETGLTDWTGFTGTESVSTSQANTGSRSLQLTGSGSGASQVLDVLPGVSYAFSSYAKTTSTDYSSVGLTFFDSNWTALSEQSRQVSGNAWTPYQFTTTSPTNARYATVTAYKNGPNGTTYLDDLQVESAGNPPPSNELLKNAGFEVGLQNWNRFQGNETTTTTSVFEGSQALTLTTAGSGANQLVSVTAGETYTFSGYARTTGTDYTSFSLNFLDSNFASLSADNLQITGSNWSPYQVQKLAPGGSRYATVTAYKNGSGGALYVDGLSLLRTNSSVDTTPPTAMVTAGSVTTAGASTYSFTVAYQDNIAIDIASLDNTDLRVTGPNGFNQLATWINVNPNSNGTPRTATYQINAPGGTWDSADNGTYTLALQANQVRDTAGNGAIAATLGNFAVNIAAGNPGVIGLQSSTVSVNEGSGSATLTVVRSQGSTGTVTVDYSTVAGVATANSDYTPRAGTLTFAPGVTQQSVTIPILEDSLVEGSESFGFAIDNVTGGATLLAPRTAQVTIGDNDGFTYRGNQYVLTNGAKTWAQAQAEAQSLGGNLVTINTAAEETWLKQTFGSTEGFWLGLNDTAVEGQFRWVSGQPVTYTNWAPGEPNNNGGNQDYGQMNYGTNRQWDDVGAITLRGIIEIGGNNGATTGNGNGLKGEYYDNSNLTNLKLTRTDASINFNWGNGSPTPTIGSDTFSVRWTGQVQPLYSETYTFRSTTDDGVRLWVNNQQIINRFIDQAPTSYTGTISLTAGQKYDIRMEYYENQGGAVAQLAWSSASQPLEIIPQSQLYSAPVDSRTLTAQTVIANLTEPTAVEWSPDGTKLYVAEKRGVVKVYENGALRATPFIDISGQVNNIRDRGLLDIAVHPDFVNNPYVYLLYTYDPPQVNSFTGLAGPDGMGNRAARLTRVTADAATNYRTAIPGSEVVLLGKNSTWNNFNGFVNSTDNFSEPPGGILANGTNVQDFLAADSESHTIGSVEFGPDGTLYVSNGDGTSYNQRDPRTVRVQDVNNLSGKILRIDPITGRGLSNNPFYDGNPDSNRSKVYQYGVRNPFRITVDQSNGKVFVGDVGWTQWEEINAAGAGANFGWPYYEGGSGNSLRTSEYQNLPQAQAFYASGQTVTPSLFALNHATDGINAIVMGDIYSGTTYPDQYRGDLFFNDLGQGIVRNISFNAAGGVASVDTFTTGANYVVQMITGPDGNLYYVDIDNGTVGRWVFV